MKTSIVPKIRRERKKIIAEVPIVGYFILDGLGAVKNKFTRNFGYMLDGLLRRADVTVYDEGGTGRTLKTSSGGLLWSATSSTEMGNAIFFHFGLGTTSPTVTDNNLASPQEFTPTNYIDVIEGDTETQLLIGAKWSPDVERAYSEVGLKLFTDIYYNYVTLLTRSLIGPPLLSRSVYTDYFDAYIVSFPASITKWFVRALLCSMAGQRRRPTRCLSAIATDGSMFSIRSGDTFAGSPDIQIGSDNTTPSPSQYKLVSPIGSLASQTQTVEVDTTANEVRVLRCGSITPTTDLTLGEIGLFAVLHGFVAGSAVTRTVMIGRITLPTVQTLFAGNTYTICFMFRLV